MRYLFIHAHPDDETLSSGPIIAGLVAEGDQALVLTATRGELGEAVAGSLPVGADLVAVRQGERAAALAILGASDAGWLGAGANRAAGRAERIYRDSGMEWVSAGRAGPSRRASADSLWRAARNEVIDDLCAAAGRLDADRLVSYAADGGYGHPDHLRCHQAALAAARRLERPFYEIIFTPGPAVSWYDLSDRPAVVAAAHRAYRSQFSLVGQEIRHVGGQVDQLRLAAGLRLVAPAAVACERGG